MHAEEEAKLLAPIRAHVGEIQAKIDALRKDGSDQVQKLKNRIQLLKEDKQHPKGQEGCADCRGNCGAHGGTGD